MTERQIREMLDKVGWDYWIEDIREMEILCAYFHRFPQIELLFGGSYNNGSERFGGVTLVSTIIDSPQLYLSIPASNAATDESKRLKKVITLYTGLVTSLKEVL